MIQLTLGGPRIVEDDEWVAQQREFAQRHCVVFKDFVEESILSRVPRMLEAGEFFTHENLTPWGEVFSRELQMRARARLPQVFFLLLNQPRLFDAIAELTGCEAAIRCFRGRSFKLFPGGEYFIDWHNDNPRSGRLFGLTIDLSPKPCGGGFQIRSRKTEEVFQTVTGTRFGDAYLFRIHGSLEHRSLPVEGPAPRCVYLGWFFGAGADYREITRATIRPREDQAGSPPRPPG